MTPSATYFDGRTARSVQGTLHLSGGSLRFQSAQLNLQIDPSTISVVAPVGSGTWRLELVNGAYIQFSDENIGSEIARTKGHSRIVDRMEASWQWAILALAVAVLGTWALLVYGVPVGARHIAFSIPPEIDARIGAESGDILDRVFFEPTELSPEEQARVRALFSDITDDDVEFARYKLHFRESASIGANAFAVPGGIVVITDDMVELAISDAELIAVLAHEVGHLANRHGMRLVLQNSASALIIAGLTGDLASLTALSATVPTVLMQAKYSREFEQEADEFAFAYLRTKGLDENALSGLLQRLETAKDGDPDIPGWLSSHPPSKDRRPDD